MTGLLAGINKILPWLLVLIKSYTASAKPAVITRHCSMIKVEKDSTNQFRFIFGGLGLFPIQWTSKSLVYHVWFQLCTLLKYCFGFCAGDIDTMMILFPVKYNTIWYTWVLFESHLNTQSSIKKGTIIINSSCYVNYLITFFQNLSSSSTII